MVLVTGASGMLGSELTRQLVSKGVAIRVFVRRSSRLDLLESVINELDVFYGDVRDSDAVENALEGISEVYHTAASMGFGGSRKENRIIHDVNVRGTATVVDASRKAGVRRLVHTSSIAALGRPVNQNEPIVESIAWQPSIFNTKYATSKYRAELEVQRSIAEGLDAVIVNPTLVFGPARKGENTWQIVERVAKRRIPAVPYGGTNVVDVRDVANGLIRAMQTGKTGERYILGSTNLSWEEIFQTLASALRVDPPKRRMSPTIALALANVFEPLGHLIGKTPVINRENARITGATYRYSNQKAIQDLGCAFRSFNETASFLANEWLRRHG